MFKDSSKINILFFGTPDFAVPSLNKLLSEKWNIVGVVTQADKKFGRKQELRFSEVKKVALQNNIPILQPNRITSDFIDHIKALDIDVIIVVAYGKILPKALLEIPRFGAINVHASLLPQYRGASPIQEALLNGDTETGITIMHMDEKMDEGNILSQKKISLSANISCPELFQNLAHIGAQLLHSTLQGVIHKKIIPQQQNHQLASYCRKITRENGEINWNKPTVNIYNQFRAYTPWPGVYTFWEKAHQEIRIKIWEMSCANNEYPTLERTGKHAPGRVSAKNAQIYVHTKDGAICLSKLQIEGKSPVDAKTFLNGYPDFIGAQLY